MIKNIKIHPHLSDHKSLNGTRVAINVAVESHKVVPIWFLECLTKSCSFLVLAHQL